MQERAALGGNLPEQQLIGQQIGALEAHQRPFDGAAGVAQPGQHAELAHLLGADAAGQAAIARGVFPVLVGTPGLAQQQHRVARFKPARQRAAHRFPAPGLLGRRIARTGAGLVVVGLQVFLQFFQAGTCAEKLALDLAAPAIDGVLDAGEQPCSSVAAVGCGRFGAAGRGERVALLDAVHHEAAGARGKVFGVQQGFEPGQTTLLRQLGQGAGGKGVEHAGQRCVARLACGQRRHGLCAGVAHRERDRAGRRHAGRTVIEGATAAAPGHVEHSAVAQQLARPVAQKMPLPRTHRFEQHVAAIGIAQDAADTHAHLGRILVDLRRLGGHRRATGHRFANALETQHVEGLHLVGAVQQLVGQRALVAQRVQRHVAHGPGHAFDQAQPAVLVLRTVQRVVFEPAVPAADQVAHRPMGHAGERIVKTQQVFHVVVVHGEGRLARAGGVERRPGRRAAVFAPVGQWHHAPLCGIERAGDDPGRHPARAGGCGAGQCAHHQPAVGHGRVGGALRAAHFRLPALRLCAGGQRRVGRRVVALAAGERVGQGPVQVDTGGPPTHGGKGFGASGVRVQRVDAHRRPLGRGGLRGGHRQGFEHDGHQHARSAPGAAVPVDRAAGRYAVGQRQVAREQFGLEVALGHGAPPVFSRRTGA